MSVDFVGVGLTANELLLDVDISDLDALDDDPPPPPRRRYQPTGWWTPTPSEAWYLDYPSFENRQDRAHYMIWEMGRSALAMIDGATADDPIFPHDGEMVSLNELLASVSRDAVDEIRDYLE